MKKVRVSKAVIAAAGLGTRLLPATKAMPKEMLPIVDKPAIQYIVEEIVRAAIREIIIVTSWQKRALEDHFDISPELERSLEEAGKMKELRQVREVSRLAHFTYLRQKLAKGNGVPALEAAPLLGDEPFLYVFGDDLVMKKDGSSFFKEMLQAFAQVQQPLMVVTEVPTKELRRFGVIRAHREGSLLRVEEIIEKPEPKKTPSNLAVIGYYILNADFMKSLKATKPGRHGEIWLTDALKAHARKGKIYALTLKGADWYTVGEPLSYLETIFSLALKRPDLKKALKSFIQSKLL